MSRSSPLKFIKKLLLPSKGKPERKRFSMGDRPIPGKQPTEKSQRPEQKTKLSKKLIDNIKDLESAFHVPDSSDVVIRKFSCAEPRVNVAVAFIEGLADSDKIHNSVLSPLMFLSSLRKPEENKPADQIRKALIANAQVVIKSTLEEIIETMILGDTIVLIEGSDIALSVETKGWEHRTVTQPTTERTVKGPQTGFIEVLRVNTALIRSFIQSPDLVVESVNVGSRFKLPCAILYMANLTNPKIVQEFRRRLISIETDNILTSGQLEQMIETSHTLLPTIFTTERPDKVVSFLLEGACAVLTPNDPYALVAPATFFAFLHSPEDYYIRWPYGSILRLIRFVAFFLAIYLPGLFIGILNYHPEMIPSVLLISLAGTREPVPFPLPLEVLLMFLGFELIREAGIRIPSPLGPTIGIVGALLIGEAAVTANLASPIMVIVISVTAVASFTISNPDMGVFLRLATLLFIFIGTVMGLYGIVALTYVLISHLVSLNSFGVPFMSPWTPRRKSNVDAVLKGAVWNSEMPLLFLHPQRKRRQSNISRLWDIGELEDTIERQGGENRDHKNPGGRN